MLIKNNRFSLDLNRNNSKFFVQLFFKKVANIMFRIAKNEK